jgi:site-specific DNA-methyltransferase (adenine-specific)
MSEPRNYYSDDYVTLVHGDCTKVVPPAATHLITDPPYDPTTHAGAHSDLRPTYKICFDPLNFSLFSYLTQLSMPRWSLAFCSMEMLGVYSEAVSARWVRSGFWDRMDGAPQFSGDRPAQPGEGIAIWHGTSVRKRWNRNGMRALWRFGIVRGEERVHETQKPVQLMRALVLDFTDPGDLIFDPFAGSGTTGVAAKQCGRKAVLIENDEARCERAAKRLSETQVDTRVYGAKDPRAKQQAFAIADIYQPQSRSEWEDAE